MVYIIENYCRIAEIIIKKNNKNNKIKVSVLMCYKKIQDKKTKN